jgi:tRNA G37 N-methylase Trm5
MEEAIRCLKKGIVHFYCFAEEDKINEKRKKILSVSKKLKKKAKILSISRVLPYGPRIWKYRIDFRVS